MKNDYQLAIDSINIVRTLIDSAIADGRANDAWILAGKHALMIKSAADQQALVVAERMQAERLQAEVAAEVAAAEKAAAEKAAAEKAAAPIAAIEALLAREELQAQQLAREIAERDNKC